MMWNKKYATPFLPTIYTKKYRDVLSGDPNHVNLNKHPYFYELGVKLVELYVPFSMLVAKFAGVTATLSVLHCGVHFLRATEV